MIWRSTIFFLTGLTVVTVPVANLQAKTAPVLMAQSATSPLQRATSEQQIEEIKTLQQELKNRGYYNGPIDGIYGPGTDRAIRELRGQKDANSGGLTPSFPEIAVPADALPETEPSEDAQDASASGAEDGSVGIDADNIPENTDEITIGNSVSPETGIDPSNANTDEPSDSETVQDAGVTAPGPGRLIWPGLALIAALGSFGIGFVLANRVKLGTDEENESPWGTIPEAVKRSDEHPVFPEIAHNGHAVANGSSSVNADRMVSPSSETDGNMPIVSNASVVDASGRLAKVDVIDELVATLQVTDPGKRRKAIWELGQRGNSSAVQHLVNSMVDADSKEKSLILAALSEIGIRSLKPMNRALAIALQDENPDVRKNAIRDLTRVYELVTQISQMLGHATEDDDPEVRKTAEWALNQLNRIREAPKLKSSLNALEAARSTPDLLPDEVENLKN